MFLSKWFIGNAQYEIEELEIKVSDLFPVKAADGGDLKFQLTWEQLRAGVERFRYHMALQRYEKMRSALRKRQDAIDDPGYDEGDE